MIIIIIGLPGSGKTYLSNSYKDYSIYDDYYCKYFTCNLKDVFGQNVIINDPRLCYLEIFEIFVMELNKIIKENKLENNKIKYIFFKNDLEKCYNNIKNNNIKKISYQELRNMSKVYNIQNLVNLINDSEFEIIDVYS